MKKTLVLVVDRDDDFGVKGRVNTPVIGKEECIEAANALGIADPEDSDTNALYAAISMCMDLQEDGFDAEVSLICGDEKVGHRSDLALVAQLEEVLDIVRPESVILVGDGIAKASGLEKCMAGELVEFPYGYHTTVTAPGYQTYFLWLMAGDYQGFNRSNDPAHDWIK